VIFVDIRRRWRFSTGSTGPNRIEIVHATPRLERDAWTWLGRHDERSYSFVDATSFSLTRHLRIRDAFAFDGDFAAAGFVGLRP
jgi:predicted nucleic acid-binding protein